MAYHRKTSWIAAATTGAGMSKRGRTSAVPTAKTSKHRGRMRPSILATHRRLQREAGRKGELSAPSQRLPLAGAAVLPALAVLMATADDDA
jgi:ribosomal protein L32